MAASAILVRKRTYSRRCYARLTGKDGVPWCSPSTSSLTTTLTSSACLDQALSLL